MVFLLYLQKIRNLQTLVSLYILRLIFYKNIFYRIPLRQKKSKQIFCYGDTSKWLLNLNEKNGYSIVDLTTPKTSIRTIHRQIFTLNVNNLPNSIYIVFPEITKTETFDERQRCYKIVYLPQPKKENSDFVIKNIINGIPSNFYKNFLDHYSYETLINDSICCIKQIQAFCVKNEIELLFFIPKFFFQTIDKETLKNIFNTNFFLYKETDESYREIANIINSFKFNEKGKNTGCE